MSLRQTLGRDVQRVYEQLDELLDREDVVVAFFDGHRVVTYMHGFDVSPSQLELLGVELERTVRSAVGRPPATRAGKRRRHELHQGNRNHGRVDRDGDGVAGRVLRLAGKVA
jgi:hypothetical protein